MTIARRMHEGWAPSLELAIREVFDLMLGCQLTVPQDAKENVLDVTSMVGLAGLPCGVMSIRCGRESAGLMASRMLGIDPDQIGPELCDAVGEICNMVAGNFKNKISRMSEECMLSIPTVITGSAYRHHALADSDALEIRLLFEGMPLVISLQVHH
jgi:chemotaxis protein CheX